MRILITGEPGRFTVETGTGEAYRVQEPGSVVDLVRDMLGVIPVSDALPASDALVDTGAPAAQPDNGREG